MTASRRILVVTYAWPPQPSAGYSRWQALAHYLQQMGVGVGFLTTGAFGELPDDRAKSVTRTYDLAGARPIRRLLRRPPLPTGGTTFDEEQPPGALITKVIVPDAFLVSWVPFALRSMARLVRTRGYDCVVTTSPYDSTHLIGLAARQLGPAWLADFRDPWVFEPVREAFPFQVQRRLDARLERTVVRRADRVVANQVPVLEDFRRRLGVSGGYVPNGWDPRLESGITDPRPLVEGKRTILHTGGLSGPWGRNPEPFFRAVALATSTDQIVRERLRVQLAGPLRPPESGLIDRYGLENVIQHVGAVSRGEAIRMQRQADALLLITSHRTSEAPGKLFEYLGSGRPILALASGNEAERILTETRRGCSVPPGDVEGIAAALGRVARGELSLPDATKRLDRYEHPAPAEAMLREIEIALARRGEAK